MNRTAALLAALIVSGGCRAPNASSSAARPAGGITLRASTPLDTLASHALGYAAVKLAAAADSLDPAKGYPRMTVGRDGAWTQEPVTQWTSGFFPGTLWYMYEVTHDPIWRARAERWTAGVESAKTRTSTHDLGFLVMDSFGQGYRLTGNPHYLDVILTASRSLVTRYNPAVGAIKSWDLEKATDRRSTWRFPVIVDNMMNLEMLYWASQQPGGDPKWKEIATRHAETSLKAHVRDDASTAHVALFDPQSGAFLARVTWQGYADTSAWARGQAWAIYGFTTSYRETRKPEFLAGAQRTADWFIAHLPEDKVPYWDFRAPSFPTERDVSAGAVATSALFELATLTAGDRGARYRATAEQMLASLARNYTTEGTRNAAILAHSVGGKPFNSEVDVGITYADYYFVEALVRYERER
jgi:hypothetical protein